jgi:hypothetical protein
MPSIRFTVSYDRPPSSHDSTAVAVCSTDASCTVTGVFAVPQCCAAKLGSSLPTFRDNLSVPPKCAHSTTVNCEECHCIAGRYAVPDGVFCVFWQGRTMAQFGY